MATASDTDTVEGRLGKVVEQLGIPSSTLQITQVRLNRLGTEPDIDDARMDEVAAAALALSAREDGLPVSEREIADAWSSVLDAADVDAAVSHDQLTDQLNAVAEYLDLGTPPAHPGDLIRDFGAEQGMSDRLVEVAQRILHDAFESDPTVVAGGTSPAGTAGAVLYLAAEINGLEGDHDQDTLGDISETSAVTVRNRYREIRDLLGEDRLSAARYLLDGDRDETQEAKATATDGNGNAEAETPTPTEDAPADEVVEAETPDPEPDTTEETTPEPTEAAGMADEQATEVAVENEVDALTDALDVDPSVRLFAMGMVGDAVDGVAAENAEKLAGAALVAGARINETTLDAADVAEEGGFRSRDIAGMLDHLDTEVDVDIPRRSAEQVVDQLVEELDLSEEVREESRLALEQYQADEIDAEYTAAELGAGAVFFAATVGRTQVDIGELSAITGAATEYVTDAMNSVVVSLCRSLVRGDIDYESTSWTTDLLESELSPDIGDSYTGRVIAIAKTYTAGREGQHVDDATLDVLLSPE